MPNGVYNDTTVSIMMSNNNNGNVLQQRAASLPHHFVMPPEPDYDIYADLPKPTPNSVSFITRHAFQIQLHFCWPIFYCPQKIDHNLSGRFQGQAEFNRINFESY